MSQDWKQWEGQVVNGKFPLLRYLGAPSTVLYFSHRV